VVPDARSPEAVFPPFNSEFMRLPARFLLTGAAVLAVASCSSDGSIAPAGAPAVSGSPVLRALAVAQSVDFTIPAQGGTINILDAYTLSFPANSVCDPNASDTQAGYASKSWDAPCTVSSGDIQVRATLKWSNGVLYADFQPALRFVPSKVVTLSTTVLAPLVRYYNNAGIRQGWSIGYTPGIDALGTSDALTDPTLRTVISAASGTLSRRVKHFSGYFIITGDGYIPCDPAQGNPLCVWVDDES
jgi:hypothetical protein